ncbi:protein FAM111A-like [Labeo rohita]|uniref:Protein FAM111A-like n=1 Tax=Labeo rohita TaxID=84645 RepID=A0A498P120_LABRO|nr:protein FAM111A-like [Labeo rohita]
MDKINRTSKNMSTEPPKKKFKQTDPGSTKQTDTEPGEMSQTTDNVQSAKGEGHPFHFRYKSKKHALESDTNTTVLDALNANKAFRKIKEDNMDKEIVIQRSEGAVPRAAVNTDFPCCLIERDEVLNITFIKNGGNVDTKKKTTGKHSFSNESENLHPLHSDSFTIFYIKTKGGDKVKRLMKNNELRNKVNDVCVYAFKKDKVKAALRRDGRFSSVIFNKECTLYSLDRETHYQMSHTVKDLNGMHFEMTVMSNEKQPDSQDSVLSDVSTEMNEASAADLKEDPNQHPVNTEQSQKRNTMKSTNPSTNSLKDIPDSKEILQILRDQYKGLVNNLKEREKLKDNSQVQKFFRAEYDKSVQSFSEVYKIRQLMTDSNFVCQIQAEGFAKGTGFLLFGRFVLTNAHVIKQFLESPDKLFLTKDLQAAFNSEHPRSKVKLVPVKKQIAAYCFITDDNHCRLDFALLELVEIELDELKLVDVHDDDDDDDDDDNDDDNDDGDYKIKVRPDLLSFYKPGPLPNIGGICIVGHPDGGIKRMDPCFIIGKENLQKAADKHISENYDFFPVIKQQSLADKWDLYKNQINYDSCFFNGSSGSPVFDDNCNLIGVHTGGYVYKGENSKTRSIMEYAYSMQPILESIITQAKKSKRSDILKLLSNYKSLNLNFGDNDVDME